MEADSLNAIVLGPDAVPGTEEFDLFIKEVGKEMTLKCGQRCTGARRILVPQNVLEDVQIAIGKRLGGTVIGDPRVDGVRMGALAGQTQRNEVKRALDELLKGSQIVYGSADSVDVRGADAAKGAFMSPILLLNPDPWKNQQSHNVEAFGPVSTLMPYTDIDDAVALTKLGKGSLCASIATYDERWRSNSCGAPPATTAACSSSTATWRRRTPATDHRWPRWYTAAPVARAAAKRWAASAA
jgi:oxepin-CoA hydrolase/3-oxo-5,6-dehydrosuberyl-CoA semialdehyde dehydrogenase